MKKSILIIFFTLVAAMSASSQTAKKLFLAMPDSIFPVLTSSNKADFIDFLASKMKAEVKNAFGLTSQMTDLTNDYIKINVSSSSTWQMKVLPLSDKDSTKVICVVRTVKAGSALDSDIHFYDTQWREQLANDYLKLPSKDDFFIKPSSSNPDDSISEKYQEAYRNADVCMMTASLEKDSLNLVFQYTTPAFLGKEKTEEIKPFIRESILYRWNKGKFTSVVNK
jgi:hypothetical protein